MVCHQRSIIRTSRQEDEAQGTLKGPKVPLDPPTALGWVCLISHHAKTRDSWNPSHGLLLFLQLSITFFNALQMMKTRLGANAVPVTLPIGEGDLFCGIIDFSTTLHNVDISASKEERAQAVAEGSVLGAYQYIKYRTVDRQKIKVIQSITLVGDGVGAFVEKGAVLAECENFVRDLANEPASNLKPEQLANSAKELSRLGVKVVVYDKKGIEKLGLSALLAVNRGSVNEPRFVVMEYDGGKKRVALVGKGITFDSGGLDLKPEDGMFTMKHDMCGAATVIAVVKAAALLKLKVHVIGVFVATENMPGMDAYKPGDIVKTYSGKTIEVINTDAEGRVILSDALAYTEKVFKPDAIIDLATLTGACVVALGNVCAGIIGRDKKLIMEIFAKTGIKWNESEVIRSIKTVNITKLAT